MEMYNNFFNEHIKYFATYDTYKEAFTYELDENDLYKYNKYFKVYYNELGQIIREEYYLNQKLNWFFLYHYDSKNRLYLRETYDQNNVCIFVKDFSIEREEDDEDDDEQSFIDQLVSGFNAGNPDNEQVRKKSSEEIIQDEIDDIVMRTTGLKKPENKCKIEKLDDEKLKIISKEKTFVVENDDEKNIIDDILVSKENNEQKEKSAKKIVYQEKEEITPKKPSEDSLLYLVDMKFTSDNLKTKVLVKKLKSYIIRYQKLLNKDLFGKDIKYFMEPPLKRHIRIYYKALRKICKCISEMDELKNIIELLDSKKVFQKYKYLENIDIDIDDINYPKNSFSTLLKYYKAILSERNDLKESSQKKMKTNIIKKINQLKEFFKELNSLAKKDYKLVKQRIKNVSDKKLQTNFENIFQLELFLEKQIFKTINELNKQTKKDE